MGKLKVMKNSEQIWAFPYNKITIKIANIITNKITIKIADTITNYNNKYNNESNNL